MKQPLKDAIEAFDNGTQKEGIQAFQKKILESIRESQLSSMQRVHCSKVGVDPENRDACGLVPADVHDLLKIIAGQGWDYDMCRAALASEIQKACAIRRRRAQLAMHMRMRVNGDERGEMGGG